jgi:hypothetical protein
MHISSVLLLLLLASMLAQPSLIKQAAFELVSQPDSLPQCHTASTWSSSSCYQSSHSINAIDPAVPHRIHLVQRCCALCLVGE